MRVGDSAGAPVAGSAPSAFQRFQAWRRGRPFGGGICLLISAIFLGLPTLNSFQVGDLVLTVSTISGVSTVVLAVLMGLCCIAVLFWSHTRILAGVAAMIIALVAFPAANFGGYILGTLIGVVGSALVLAWRPLPTDDDVAGEAQPGESTETLVIGDPAAGGTAAGEPAVGETAVGGEPTEVVEPVVIADESPTETLPAVELNAPTAPVDQEDSSAR